MNPQKNESSKEQFFKTLHLGFFYTYKGDTLLVNNASLYVLQHHHNVALLLHKI